MYRLWLLLLPLLVALPVLANDEPIKIKEVVVTATKIEEPVEETTSNIIVIPEKQLEAKNVEFVVDILKDVPELNIVQNGGQGKLAQVFLRGGGPTQVLVMIDGVKIKSTTTGTFDFAGITTEDIERIEIVKGPRSTIYGSEAMAGVINIITKKGKDKTKADLTLEGGSFGTHKTSASISGGSSTFNYRFTTAYFSTDGISTAKGGVERDGYKNALFSTKLNIKPSEIFNFELLGRYYYDRSELDDYNYILRESSDALNYVQHGHHYVASGKGSLYLFDIWEQILTVSNTKDSLKTRDTDTSWNNYDIITGTETIDWQHNLYLSNNYTLTAGFENRLEKGESKGNFTKSIYNNALYVNNKFSLLDNSLYLNAGIRYDEHKTFGYKYTYRVGAAHDIEPAGLKIMVNYGTGFRAPTFNELFWPADPVWGGGGNPDLKPEESNSWETGIEKSFLSEKVIFSVTYFNQRYDNLIAGWPPVNINNAEVKGIETGISAKITGSLTVKSTYTNMDTEDNEGQRLTRRPKDKLNITVEYSGDSTNITTGYTFVGEVYDSTARRNLASYSLVNLSGDYKVTNHLKLFTRIDNLLNEDYESTGGYNTPGFSAFAGVKLEI